MMVAIHAVLAAGGQFVPIDTEAPADRVELHAQHRRSIGRSADDRRR